VTDERCDVLCLDLERAEALRHARLSPDEARLIADQAKALGDPTRLVIAIALRDGGPACVCDMAWVTERAENLVSHHLRWLRNSGLVRSRRDGRMVIYELTDRGRLLLDAVRGDVTPVTA